MIIKVDHIGIAVKDISNANKLFSALLGRQQYKMEEVESENVLTSFFAIDDTKVELLAATSDQSSISKFIEKKGEGIHHVAFEVEDIFKAIEQLKREGFTFINEVPKQGADNKLICFIHPKSSNGVLVELCQTIKDKCQDTGCPVS